MAETKLAEMVVRREYDRLDKYAKAYLKRNGWSILLQQIKDVDDGGRGRDAIVSLLKLEAVGGTDSAVFLEFSDLKGDSLEQVRGRAVEHAVEILREQIENRHTYFIDIEEMAKSHFALLVKDVIDARKRELAELGHKPSRIDVLGTFYGFKILVTGGSQPLNEPTGKQAGYRYRYRRRRTWLDELITDSAALAIRRITREFADEVEMRKEYRTLGSSRVFKSRCTPATADILANAVRLSLYKTPGHRGTAARRLGTTEDSRVLPFLHHRLAIEPSRKVRTRIAQALGRVGHVDSVGVLRGQLHSPRGRLSKEEAATIAAIGKVYSKQSEEILLDLLKTGGNAVVAGAISALADCKRDGLITHISPFLEHRSRPVVRAAVLALTGLGRDGRERTKERIPLILRRIGNDKPSRNAVSRVLDIEGVAKQEVVHEFFAKKIDRLREKAENWSRATQRRMASWYHSRWERRARQELRNALQMADSRLQPPFHPEVLRAVEDAVTSFPEFAHEFKRLTDKLEVAIGENQERPVKKDREPGSSEQTYL